MRLRDGKKAGTLLLAVLLLTGCGGAADTASNVGTDAAVDTVTTAAADTAAGTWELVSMTYNGMTVGKEDLWISWRTVPEPWIMTGRSMI